ncbi:universal stress protein [Algoriphagus boritolerans]|uniref:Nucleotide-binding universal stress protein, UspA family n=1 Tax=Algoriphagus boritolerans DSM 17298 = JCM 18970 TaxID=1120964 RepID=A0A1H5VKQ5_9BACT|nr:universal stress protein [Algoriphagus boritolerans]SEF87783.1 Nucleotide-binding universal stress protein, UspA family [Algoriphagus boritolerans DSM 17298 = JCM 18970]
MKLIVPIDFSENSIKALEFAIFMADKKHGEITLVHVVEVVYDFASQAAIALDTMIKDGEKLLIKLIEKYEASGVKMDYKITDGVPSISIVRIADELGVSLIVMGTQGASGIKKALIGTTTVNLIREANCPVLVVPAQAKVTEINKVTLALEFANHEEKFIDWIIFMSEKWELGLEILHVQTSQGFKEELAILGLEGYLQKKYPGLKVRIHTFYAESASEGLDLYMQENENMILVMCHEHRNLWDQIIHKSKSLQMAYHTHIPLLIMS